MKKLIVLIAMVLSFGSCAQQKPEKTASKTSSIEKIEKSEAEWKKELTEMEYYVLREKGTERAFTSELNDNKRRDLFMCCLSASPF